MNKLFSIIFFILCIQISCISSFNKIEELQTQLKSQQISFLLSNLHDIESVKSIISTMYSIDQKIIKLFIQDKNNPQLISFLTTTRQCHAKNMKDILAIHTWMNISTFGPEADNQAFMLIQHSDNDLHFQAECLMVLEDLYQKNETNPKNYAYLYDRVALKSPQMGMKQKYGTQFCILNSNEILLEPYDGTIEEINLQRKKIGLSSIKEYLKQIQNIYHNDL